MAMPVITGTAAPVKVLGRAANIQADIELVFTEDENMQNLFLGVICYPYYILYMWLYSIQFNDRRK